MPEEIVRGNSLEEIKQEWADKLKILPEDIILEVIEKPRLLSRKWKVHLSWNDPLGQDLPASPTAQTAPAAPDSPLTSSRVIWDENKYVITLGEGVQRILPFPQAGEILLNGKIQDKPFRVSLGDHVEFHPLVQEEQLTWEVQVRHQGLSVVAKVRHLQSGHYILAADLPALAEIDFAQYVRWEDLPSQDKGWDEAKLNYDLEQLRVVHGHRPERWPEILAVRGVGEVVLAEATLPIPSVNAQLADFVGDPQPLSVGDEEKIDFFASKVKLVEEGAVLARKIPGKEGTPGKDVLGKELGVAAVKDFQFRLKKNVHLSDDGLEVIASCAGQPVRVDEKTYLVENVYVRHGDVDLETGSIEFPGDVYIQGSVQDGLHVFAGGKMEISGSVSRAELRAEKGAKIHQSLIGGKVIIGAKFVVRLELLRRLSELQKLLNICLLNTTAMLKASGAANLKPGQCLKLLLEKQFPEIPKQAMGLERFAADHKQDEMVTDNLVVSLQTAKQYLTGLGPLNPLSLPNLQRVNELLEQFIENMYVEIPEKLNLEIGYVQGANIECSGSFKCYKGIYNSEIHVENDVVIEGVCRGGKIFTGGMAKINELGGSGVSSTFVQIGSDSHLSVNHCHPNVVIAVGKEIVQIEEASYQLEIYREEGRVQVEKLRTKPL